MRNRLIGKRVSGSTEPEDKSMLLRPVYDLYVPYEDKARREVVFVRINNAGTMYETMESADGVNRYTARDFGRVTGTRGDLRDVPPISLFNFLNQLQRSGITNMFGAPRYLQDLWGMSRNNAIQVFLQWTEMKAWEEYHDDEDD